MHRYQPGLGVRFTVMLAPVAGLVACAVWLAAGVCAGPLCGVVFRWGERSACRAGPPAERDQHHHYGGGGDPMPGRPGLLWLCCAQPAKGALQREVVIGWAVEKRR